VDVSWVSEFVGAAAMVVTAVAVLPQLVRILRVRSTAGVSPVWAMLGVVSTGAWTAYTAARGLWWATLADALSCLAYTAAVVVLARNGVRPRYVAGALWLCVFIVSYVVGGLSGVGAVLAVAFLIQVAPSIWTAYQSEDLRGASLGTWLLTCTEGALWGFYGLVKGDLAVLAFGLFAVFASLLMILRIRWWGRQRSSPAMVVEVA
jgi:uncharacterized protein with PQ loop repeat